MFQLLQAGLRLVLIGAASLVLALIGIFLSIVAAVRRAYERWRGIDNAYPLGISNELHSLPRLIRDRDHHALHRGRYGSRKSTSATVLPKVPSVDDISNPSSPLRSSPEPLPDESNAATSTSASSRQRRRGQHRRKTSTKMSEMALPSIDTAMEHVDEPALMNPVRPPLDVRGSADGRDAVRMSSSPAYLLSDSSTAQSSEPSMESMPQGAAERPPSPSRRVLQRLRERHSHLRDRCLSRVHSMPNAKTAKAARRTDPYQAPYYFPTPLSPDAENYIKEVREERKSARTTTDPIAFRQYWEPVPLPSPRASPRSKALPLPPVDLEPDHEVVTSESSEGHFEPKGQPEGEQGVRQMHHRWSFHLPRRPRKMQSTEASTHLEGASNDKHNSPTRFLFGHHRRRHGTASEDLQAKRTLAS
ncbi:hypothetical protein BD414DRAFT_420074 [Trametes punicea]|nr:hypothetical protein BD414DRAFT_420074 [Trametes punicea]